MGGENRREIVPRALSSPPQYASARRGTSSNATQKKKGVFHCFYLVLVTMQFSTADEASVSAAIHSSKFMSVNP